MIHFKKVRMKNFLSVGNNFLEIMLDTHHTNLVYGKNGSGKSLILTDSITFALFGKAFRKINKPQLMNSINRKDCVVEVEFTANGKEYLIRRGMKPNIFEIYENGEMIQQDARSDDYQAMLEDDILKMNYSAFTQTVIIGHATYSPFLKLTPTQRREVVEKLLDIDVFTKMNVLLKDDISATKESLTQVTQDEKRLAETESLHKEFLKKSESSVEAQLEDNRHQISGLEIVLNEKKSNLEKMQNEANGIEIDTHKLQKLKKKLTKLNEYLTTFRVKSNNINKEVEFLATHEACSVCHQNIDSNFKETYISQKTEELSKLDEGVELARTESKAASDEIDAILEQQTRRDDLVQKIHYLKLDIEGTEDQIEFLSETNKKLVSEKTSDLEDHRMRYKEVLDQIRECNSQKEYYLNKQHLNSLATILLKDDGIKTKIIRNYLPLMNKSINKYLESMDCFINLHLNGEFEEVVKTPNRADFSYNSFSEGEKMRIDIAILFTWREISRIKNSVNTNLLILDEVFDSSLDSTGIDDFMKILRSFKHDSNIFIISHKEEVLGDKFDRTIKVEKKTGFTQLRYS